MRKSEVSSKDIAEACGVSRTTVSFVLNNTPGKNIPSETRERILETARSLGYAPDPEAQRIAKRTRATVGLVVNHSDSIYADAYILRLIEGMAPVFNKKRCRLVLLPLRQRETDYLEIVKAHGLDGLMITNARADDAAMKALVELGLPCVVIGTVEGLDAPQIDIDNEKAAFAVADYLLSLGHRRIAMIVHAPLSYLAATGRLAGYRRALETRGLAYDEGLVRIADFTEASGYEAARSILSADPRPEALFAGNDAIAYGAVQAILDAGLRIPEDISIAGFDDDFPSRFLEPALTTMTLPAASLGEHAAAKVIALIDGESGVERRSILPTVLSLRDSCAPSRSHR
ncbi:MAG TPA: LacI family DNA-binding transcriptional regulator [Rectinemataceae bacterium]|nr:LacI family DNA-binding transcriptional regulator [Rectinemataceae bacterium]